LFFKKRLGQPWLSEDRPAFSAVYDFLISLISFDCFSKNPIGEARRRKKPGAAERKAILPGRLNRALAPMLPGC
jgi:hypothetical protein